MKKPSVLSMIQKEIIQGISFGTLFLVIRLAMLRFTSVFLGRLLNIIENFAKNSAYIFVILFLISSELYGICGLFLCRLDGWGGCSGNEVSGIG